MSKKYFMHSPDDRIHYFDTEEEAKKAAEKEMERYRDLHNGDWFDDNNGWFDDVEDVCYGEVKQKATKIEWKADDEEREAYNLPDDVVFLHDYKLRDVDHEKT